MNVLVRKPASQHPEFTVGISENPGTVIIVIAIYGGVSKGGARPYGYAGMMRGGILAPVYFGASAISREANTVYALAVRRAKRIISKYAPYLEDAELKLVIRKCGLLRRIEVAQINVELGGRKANFEKADAFPLWSPMVELYQNNQISTKEFTGKRKAPVVFPQLLENAKRACSQSIEKDYMKFTKMLGSSFDDFDVLEFISKTTKCN